MKKLLASISTLIVALGLVGVFATPALAESHDVFISDVNVTLTAPEADQSPSETWSATAIPQYANPVVVEGTGSIAWFELVNDQTVGLNHNFEAGGNYACEISFQVPDMCSLSEETVLRVNGDLVENDKTGVDPATKTVHIYCEWQLESAADPQTKHIDRVSFTFPDIKAGDPLYTEGWTFETSPAGILTATDCVWYRLADPASGSWEPAQGNAKEGETYAIRVEVVAFNEYRGDKNTEILIDGGSAFFTDSRIVGATHIIATCQWALPASSDEPGNDEPGAADPSANINIPPTGDSSLPFALAALALLGASGAVLALSRKRS